METINDDPPTTRTRMILEQMKKQDEAMRKHVEDQVRQVAGSIDAFRAEVRRRDEIKSGVLVRLWAWCKKVLSFAHAEADKIRLDD